MNSDLSCGVQSIGDNLISLVDNLKSKELGKWVASFTTRKRR